MESKVGRGARVGDSGRARCACVDQATRRELERIFHRREYFHQDGRGHITLLVKTIAESEGNGGALIEPVVSAVASCMRSQWTQTTAWLEAFDQISLVALLESMHALGILSEKSIAGYLAIAIENRLWRIFGPDVTPQEPVKPAPKPPAKVTRIPIIEKRIALGLELLALRSEVQWNNAYGRLGKQRFAHVDEKTAMQAASVARLYGQRAEIFRRLSWRALVELSSPSLPESARRRFEERIIAGENVKGNEIARARGPQPNGRPRQKVQSLMAA